MSYVSLAADAERMAIPLWIFPYERRGKKTAAMLRVEIVKRLYGPGHPGFKGKQADIDAHISCLVDCYTGHLGRAIQIALSAYEAAQQHAAELARQTALRRPNRKEMAFLAADVRQWSAVSNAAYATYRAARVVRREATWCLLPITMQPDDTPDSNPWPIPVPVPAVAVNASALLSASHEAMRAARIEVDTALRRPVVPVPGYEHCAPKHTAPQRFVAELERFIIRLEAEIDEKAETTA
ncbi:hypothetical protein FHX57_002117 [Paraburkholderia tropica]|uniref:hypothetical protein n=1 Tax=Paraburkholderia tropica TaxID=92647 RepID=UPI001621BCDC|nr:hypothetical protein [Paraburkholderia tropica]MBB2999786.1 hypothetical protein [Paraburkholderia tropica]